MAPRFCPRCHREIPVPAFLKQGNVKVEGTIRLNCGNCPKGYIMIRPA